MSHNQDRDRSPRQGQPVKAGISPGGEHDGNDILNWIVRYAVPLISVIAAALYGVLRLAYVFFYLWLRATPDEVGYGYSQVLSGELVGAVELVVLAAVGISVVGFAATILVRLSRWAIGKYQFTTVRLRLVDRPEMQRIAVWAFIVAIPLVLVGLPVVGWLEGAQAANGYTVRNVYLAGTIRLPVLAVEAVPATIAWTSTPKSDGLEISRRRCLLYLGQADGISVFYDVQSQESIRLPSAEIAVSLQDTTTVPIGC
jgi:hypothetical protein